LELCVSCCLGKYPDFAAVLANDAMTLDIFKVVVVQDLFDFCLIRCRTSSQSVVHQNSFRSKLKHCFGAKEPPLILDPNDPKQV